MSVANSQRASNAQIQGDTWRRFTPEERASFLSWRFGSTLDWCSLILTELAYPVEQLRWFVDAVQGLCKGKEMRIAHSTLTKRAQRFINKAQASDLVRRAIEANAEWSRLRKCLIFDIERPKPHEREGKDKRARTRYTDYLTPAAVWAQECEQKIRKSDELRWKRDREYRTKKRREILTEALTLLPGFESVEDMPESVRPKESGALSLREYIEQRERILLAENRRILARLKDDVTVDAGELDERLALLEVFHARAKRQIEAEYESTRSALLALRGNRLVRAMDFTDPERVAEEVDEILSQPPVEAPASGLAAWLDEIANPANKGKTGDTLGAAEEEPPPPPPESAITVPKGKTGDTLPGAPTADVPRFENMQDAALFWAEQGIRVFPLHEVYDGVCTCAAGAACKSAGKHPRTPNGFRDSSTDPEQVRLWWARWPTANIGGAMGSPGNLVALDVDPRHGGDASFSDLVEAHGDGWLETLTHRTGSGGFHLFFQYALDVELRNSAGKVGPGIDTRGEGGYVVLPPSLHSSGRCYDMLKVAPVRPVPAWLLATLRDELSARVVDFQELRGRNTFARASGDPFPDGTRNVGLFGVGIGRWRHGWASDVAELHAQLLEVNAARCVPPLDDAEVAKMAAHIAADYSHLRGVDAGRS